MNTYPRVFRVIWLKHLAARVTDISTVAPALAKITITITRATVHIAFVTLIFRRCRWCLDKRIAAIFATVALVTKACSVRLAFSAVVASEFIPYRVTLRDSAIRSNKIT
jgi:hypothetical protein